MLKCYFVIATVFIAGIAAANVPLKEFDNIEYRLKYYDYYEGNVEELSNILSGYGFADSFLEQVKFKEGTIFVLHTPNAEGEKYVAEWKKGDSEHRDKFRLGSSWAEIPNELHPVDARVTYRAEGNQLINTISYGTQRLQLTWEFSADQLKETMDYKDFGWSLVKFTGVYEVNNKSAEDAGKAAE